MPAARAAASASAAAAAASSGDHAAFDELPARDLPTELLLLEPAGDMLAAAAFAGGVIRAAVFAYFGNALVDASWTALLAPVAVLGIVLAVPLAFAEGRAWLRDVFLGRSNEERPAEQIDGASD